MNKAASFFALVLGTFAVLWGIGQIIEPTPGSAVGLFTLRQLLAISIFSAFIYGTLLYGEFRLAFAFGGIALLLALNLMDIPQFVESANLKVIVFLIGMFLVIGYLEENQFFEHIVAGIVRAVGPRPSLLILVLMIMATVSAALVDEVTSILFMTGTMLHLTSRYKLNPVPFILMLVFATNIGSSMSAIGNPIGVMIALNAPFTFLDFVRWSAPIALVVNVVTYLICRWWFADSFAAFAQAVHQQGETDLTEGMDHCDAESNSHPRALCWGVFLLTIGLLVTHSLSERLLGLKEGTMMVGSALAMGSLVLLLRREKARELVERRVDWWTLSFFMMLFASVGTLEHMGVTRVIAEKLIHGTGGNQFALIQIVGWATGWLSAFLDNVLAVATFMPVVHDIRATWALQHPGNPNYPEAIYWMMLFGGTFMGNMTVIGSTANIIALGVLEKRGHGTVKFWYWMKIGLIVSLISMAVASGLLYVQTDVLGWNPTLPPPAHEAITGH
jgi:Na+/H+ antiporter NhaD/arsenite permease-like protein